MSGLKKIIYAGSLGIVAIAVYIIYDRHLSTAARIGKQNMASAKKLKVGMNENGVIEIMGKPDSVEQTDKGSTTYKYSSNNVDNFDIEIYFDGDGDVTRIFLPEN